MQTSGGTLNLRASASGDARVLTTIPNGAALAITGRGDTWCAVLYEGHSGYCMTQYLESTHE